MDKTGEKSSIKVKPPEVDVATLKQPPRKVLMDSKPKNSKPWVPRLALVFGLAVAVSWHFLHQAGEIYRPTPDDPQFWFHLVVEGTIALYAAFFYLVIWKLWRRFK